MTTYGKKPPCLAEGGVINGSDKGPIVCVEITAMKPETIRKLRADYGLTQQEFAAKFAIPISTLRKWEQGATIPTGGAQAMLRDISRERQLETA